jgi:tight adherence protein B
MVRFRGVAIPVLVAVMAAVALPASARADEAKSIQVVDQKARVVDFMVYLDPNFPTTAESAVQSKVVISGVEVPSAANVIVASNAPKQAILVLDASGSMRGDRIAAAKVGATDYVNGLPDDVSIGLVSFNDTARVGIKPTTDKAAVIAAIDAVKAGRKTAMFDGILTGIDLAGSEAGTRLLLLSDGGDTASAATLDDVVAAQRASGFPIDVVALTPNALHADVLKGIASVSGGQYLFASDTAALKQAFVDATGSFGGKVAVQATVPPEVDASGKFAILTVTVDGTDLTGTAKLPRTPELAGTGAGTAVVTPSATPKPVAPVPVVDEGTNLYPWLYGLLAALIVVVLALTLAYNRRQQRAYERTLQVLWYSDAVTAKGTVMPERRDLQHQSIVRSLDKYLSSRASYSTRESELDSAEINMTPGSWLLVRWGACLLLTFILALLLGNLIVAVVIGFIVGWLGTRTFLRTRESKRRKAFEEELPDFLLLIASALRSGLSFAQALDSTAVDGQGQVSRQIRRALRETQLGSPIEEALMRVAERMQSDDMRWTVTALAIQREVGGNLSNILETAAATVHGRAELRREVRTLSAEGKLSGWVLAALPIGVFMYMALVNREYVAFFWTNTWGYILLGVMFVMFSVGVFWMSKVVKIKV